MLLFLSVLNVCYRIMVIFILIVVVWNVIGLKDFRRQVMAATVIMPFLLRVLNIK